ncbi:pentatricopeptide repeat-containing protein At2g38420, mitochondrial [Amaranthus tricolor]|uniref:pentatricopeptide repeat-containing protein At2g38420, mitochondrial n=1 Tax=Amaranthus tricolor TaxID=29722 RepID=UPI0025910BB4|nr:pentatricopeptide repeat-containing protein At2g38420, mitochondrial [Amaranthus tricolor]
MVPRPSSSNQIPNFFLRKRRKWPYLFPYKTKWNVIFNQQQALETLKKSCLSSSTPLPILQQTTQNPPKTPCHLLNCLINIFTSYQCDPTPNAYNLVFKTLIQKSQFQELKFVLSHLQNVEKFDTPERFFVDLIRVYGENGMIIEAIDLFFKIPLYRCVPTVLSLNSLLLVLCKNRECMRIVPQLLLKSRFLNIRIEESTFIILINALCRIGKVDFAVQLLNYMINDEFNPNGKLYSLVLSSLCKQKSVTLTNIEVIAVWENMKKSGFFPSREDYCNVIKLLGRQGKGKDTFDVLCEMKRGGIKPDIMCYTTVLYDLVEEEEYSRVEDLFDEILVFGLVPDVCTYNVYIKGLGKQKKSDAAYVMIGCMEELGCAPNSITYNNVLEAFCKVAELSRARELWIEMKRKGMEVNHRSYSLMIDALVTGGEIIEACGMLDEMLSKRFVPVFATFDKIICSLCHEGMISMALHTLDMVSDHGVLLGRTSWETLLLGLNLNRDRMGVTLACLVNLPEQE